MVALVGVALAVVAVKLSAFQYSLAEVLPRTQYDVTLHAELDGHDGEVRVRTFLPQSDARQVVMTEQNLTAAGVSFSSEAVGLNRVATWEQSSAQDGQSLAYRFSVLATPVRYQIDPGLRVPDTYPASVRGYLAAEEHIQVDAPEIARTAESAGADHGTILERLQAVFALTSGMKQRPFKGTTDALTALRLGEASCNGKSRLFVALARRVGVPARLVGGFVMEPGVKRTTHQWAEAYVAGHWIPFDSTNHHFAELPERYLTLYTGDEALFRHTSDINFKYRFETETVLVPSPKVKSTFRFFNVWSLFDRLGLSFMLLRTLLMLPVGALVVVLFRNVIGVPTFGTFLPALIAASAGETGLWWGLLAVLIVVVVAATVRRAFHRLQLLHSPSLAILLAAVAVTLLTTALVSDAVGARKLAYVSVFPVAVLAISAERFFLELTEKGARPAFKSLLGTLFVMAACWAVMNSLALQVLLIGFPELLLIVVAVDVYLGRWIGVRLSEYLRFKRILLPRAGGAAP
ncbi:MAG: transglutaminase [Deltaproteobacteria bacterium]|nr:transglutaminase [Deltaproteobacteria bacterium]